MSPVHGGPMLCHMHMPRAIERLREHEDVRRPIAFILVVHLLRLPWDSGERLPGLFDELDGLLVHTDQGHLGIVGQMIEVQNLLHMRHKLATLLRWDDPAFAQMWLQRVFLSVRLTVSWEADATISSSTALSANSRNVHRAWPAGGSEQRKAMRCASASPSNSGCWEGRSCFLRVRAASSPCSTKRSRMPATVRVCTENAAAIASSLQAAPSASALRIMLACLILYAADLPLRIKASSCSRSCSVRRTMYFLFILNLCPMKFWLIRSRDSRFNS